MSALATVADRLARSDMAQILLLFMAILVMVLGFGWPAGGSFANESWFSLAPARNAFLAVAAAGFGASQGLVGVVAHLGPPRTASQWLTEARATLLALLVWVLLTLPFEFISHAASFPAVSPWYSLLVTVITVPAYFGLGMLVRKLCLVARAAWALPVAVPAVVLALAWVDLRFDVSLFNPWTAALTLSPFPLVMGVVGLLTAVFLALGGRAARAMDPSAGAEGRA